MPMIKGLEATGKPAAFVFFDFMELPARLECVKDVGEAYLRGRALDDLILLSSDRVSIEIVVKAAKAEIPILISRSAPTDLAVGLAEKLSLTLVGFVRGKRLNIYSGAERVQ